MLKMFSSPGSDKSFRLAIATFVLFVVSGCATHCGLLNYCDIPESWPIADTFTVETTSGELCISGNRRSSCASKGMFQSGARVVEIYTLDDDEDENAISEMLASLTVTGSPGDQFTVACFQYNGNKILGMTEVLTGIEIRDQGGAIVATHPTHPVTRRGSLFFGC